MYTQTENLTIKAWAEEDRPREKLILQGKRQLTNAELLAIIIGSGNKKQTAVDLAKQILTEFNNNLFEISKLSMSDLMKFNGIGSAKAISIIAALELGNRLNKNKTIFNNLKITCGLDVFNIFSDLSEIKHEEFWVLFLKRNNVIISRKKISTGGLYSTIVDPKIIFNYALEQLACGLVLIHNHPSGNLQPSDVDIKLTKNLKAAAQLLEIDILDHIIIANQNYYSFRENNIVF